MKVSRINQIAVARGGIRGSQALVVGVREAQPGSEFNLSCSMHEVSRAGKTKSAKRAQGEYRAFVLLRMQSTRPGPGIKLALPALYPDSDVSRRSKHGRV